MHADRHCHGRALVADVVEFAEANRSGERTIWKADGYVLRRTRNCRRQSRERHDRVGSWVNKTDVIKRSLARRAVISGRRPRKTKVSTTLRGNLKAAHRSRRSCVSFVDGL